MVAVGGEAGLEGAGGEDGVRRLDPGVEGLADALARHRVGGPGGVADEKHPAIQGRDRRGCDSRRDGPGFVEGFGNGIGAEKGTDMGPGQEFGPLDLHLFGFEARLAEDSEPDIGAPVAERERPEIAGQDPRLEEHPKLRRGLVADAGEVGPQAVPLAEVGVVGLWFGEACLAQRRPHPVGPDRVAGGDRPEAVRSDRDGGGPLVDRDRATERVPVVHLHTGGAGDVEKGGVEVDPAGYGGEGALAVGKGEHADPAAGRAHVDIRDLVPRRHHRRSQPELVEAAQATRGEPVAATLVPRKASLVEEYDVAPGPGQGDRGGRPRRPPSDDDDVGDHARSLRPGGNDSQPAEGSRERGWLRRVW